MAHSPLDELALRYGIAPTLPDIHGSPHPVSDRTKRQILAAFGIETDSEGAVAMHLENAARLKPPVMRAARGTRCFLPEWLQRGRAWGITVQLYELRSRRNWGIGDFADLAAFSQIAAATGADFVGTNPLHPLFLADPDRCSPFSPSSRRFLNPIYIAVDRLPGSETFAEAPEVEELRQAPLVDYRRVARVKLAALRSIWSDWRRIASHPMFSDEDFALFRQESGEALHRH
ncbi:MAG TPA: 4-alpha-glucanotransferase, partial [Rhizobiaceae bacterium]|nr:4-alpha-glucanotransferase [Rhizobiaceae bacterium]